MDNVNIEETKDYEFKRSFLYKYMVCSFQYVDPCLKNGKSKLKLILFQLGRVVAVLLIWFVIGFGFFYTIETRNSTDVNALTHQHLIFIGRTAGNLWQIFNYNIGLYLFYKFPSKIQKEISELVKTSGNKSQLQQKLRVCGKRMTKFNIIILNVFVMLRFLTCLVYLAIDGKMSLRVKMLIGVALHRMLSLPFLLYFVFLVRLQALKVQIFIESLVSKNLAVKKEDLIESYIGISSSIKKTAKEYHIYVVFLVVFLCMFVLRFTNVIAGDINLIEEHSSKKPLDILYHVKETVESAIDIAIYVTVLLDISRVSLAQKNVLSKLLELKKESYHDRLDTINIFEKHHQIDGTGYNVFGIPISGMKTLLFAAFMSLSGFIARLLLTS